MKFLQLVAEDVIKKTKNILSFIIVLPNNRNISYFRYYYAQILGKVVWMPQIITIEKFFQSLTSYTLDNDISLIFNLYEVFNEVFKGDQFFGNYTVDEFLPLGRIILDDFNELDNYMIDVSKIYENIYDYNSIDFADQYLDSEQKKIISDFLGIITNNISEQNERIVALLKQLPKLYFQYKERLLKQRKLYSGLLKRIIIENPENIPIAYRKYFFVGFNALTKTERELMLFFKRNAEAYFYWDYDDFYYKDTQNEAGYFLRKNIPLLGDDGNFSTDNFRKKKKTIITMAFPEDTLQAKAIPYIFEKLHINPSDIQELSDTVIVITKENMLLPVLYSIPPTIADVNITTGLSIKNTALYALVDNWLKILLQVKNKHRINLSDLILLLKNPLIYNYLISSVDIFKSLVSQKISYIEPELLDDFKEDFLRLMFDKRNFENIFIFLQNFLNLLYFLFWNSQSSQDKTIGEFIYELYIKISNFKNFLEQKGIKNFNIEIAFLFIREMLSDIQVPFTGRTINGLQITTMLETRNLDFKNVIILNLNEEIYPSMRKRASFLSEFIRAVYGLPLVKAQDAVFAYFFYRLLQRAENVFLLYNNSFSKNTREKSRFIQQLEYETDIITQKLYYTDITIPKITLKVPTIYKDSRILSILNKYLEGEKYFSASALNVYLDCPLKFYYKYIEGIQEAEEYSAEINAAQLGSILHAIMERIYTPYKNKIITEKHILKIKQNIDQILQEAAEPITLTPIKQLYSGLNKLILEVIKEQILILLDYDLKNQPFKIIDLEKEMIMQVPLFSGKKIKIKAIFDRIDEKDDVIRLIDYKTGGDVNKARFDDIFDKNKPHTHALFQMMLYTYLHKDTPQQVEPALYVVRQLEKQAFNPAIVIDGQRLTNRENELLDKFYKNFNLLVEELTDENIPFTAAETTKPCAFCGYRYLCGR